MDFRETSLIQGLNSYWYPIDSEFHYRSDIIFCYIFRISLESDLTRSILIKKETVKYLTDFFDTQNWWSSSSEIYGLYFFVYRIHFAIILTIGRICFFGQILRFSGWQTEILSNFLFQVFDISSFFEFIKNRCQCKLAVGTLLSTKGNMDIEMMGHKYDDMNKTHKYNSVSLTSLSTTA